MPTKEEIHEAIDNDELEGISGLNSPLDESKLCDHDIDSFESAGGERKGPDVIYYYKCQECEFVFSTWFEGR